MGVELYSKLLRIGLRPWEELSTAHFHTQLDDGDSLLTALSVRFKAGTEFKAKGHKSSCRH